MEKKYKHHRCPATSQHFWKCGLWTTEFNSNFQTARSRHETTWMWKNMTLDVIYSAKGSKWQLPVFTQKIKTEEEAAWNIADLIQVFLQSILYQCIHYQFKPHTVPQVNTQQKTSNKNTISHQRLPQRFITISSPKILNLVVENRPMVA